MPWAKETIVHGRDGLRGEIVPGEAERLGLADRVVVRFEDGRRATVPVAALADREGGGYELPVGPTDLDALRDHDDASNGLEGGGLLVIPVVAEQIRIDKRKVDTGGVRVRKRIVEHEEVVDEPLMREEVEVQRVAIDRQVEAVPEIRTEGDTTIIPIVEEVVVVEKRLMLREELRVTRRRIEERRPQTVRVRAEEATVERLEGADAAAGTRREPGPRAEE